MPRCVTLTETLKKVEAAGFEEVNPLFQCRPETARAGKRRDGPLHARGPTGVCREAPRCKINSLLIATYASAVVEQSLARPSRDARAAAHIRRDHSRERMGRSGVG